MLINLIDIILNVHFVDNHIIKVRVDLDRLIVFTDYILFTFSNENSLINFVSELECNNSFIVLESKLPTFTYTFIPKVNFKTLKATVNNKLLTLLNIGDKNYSYNISDLDIKEVNELKLTNYSLIGYRIDDIRIVQAPLKIKLTI